jgi:nucleotide-binding universal stress UspA family protein
MGTHGRRGLSRGLLGSVAESVDDSLTRLMRRRPTLASGARARASVEARAHGTADALHPTMIPRHILAPIDFDDTSDRALDLAAELAKAFGASLTILHTVDIPPYAYANFGAALPPPDLLGILEHHAREALDGRLRKVQTAIPEAKVILTTGVPWREILAAVDRVSADMVVLGTQRHGWLEHALLGSVAEKIVRASPVPVLTVPPSRKQS